MIGRIVVGVGILETGCYEDFSLGHNPEKRRKHEHSWSSINETHFSAFQPVPQKHPRVPQPHGHPQWPQGPCPSPRQRKEDPQRMSHDAFYYAAQRVWEPLPSAILCPVWSLHCGRPGRGKRIRVGNHCRQKDRQSGPAQLTQTADQSMGPPGGFQPSPAL